MERLKIEYVKVDTLKTYPNNAKIHTSEQIEQIKKSIQEFGMNDPIAIWKENEIIEGHGRLIACRELGIEDVPVIRLDSLTDEQRKAYALVHNKLTMNTGFNVELLEEELSIIANVDMDSFGFDLEMLQTDRMELPSDDGDVESVEGDIPFTEYFGEETNYVILTFKNEMDWLNVQSVLGLHPVRSLSTRNDGTINEKQQHIGIGRVVDGVEAMKRIKEQVK